MVWFINNSRNTILIIIMMVVAVCTETPEQVDNYLGGCITGRRDPDDPGGENCTTLTLTKIKNVQPPSFTFPSFHYNYEFCNEKLSDQPATFDDNSTDEWVYASELRYPDDWKLSDQNLTIECETDQRQDVWFVSFNDIWIELGTGIFVQTIISILEHVSQSKTLARMPPASPLDQSQELVGWGLTNLSNSFVFGGFLITASASRSIVQYQAAKSQICQMISCVIVLVVLLFLADIFVYIPSACLAAVITVATAPLFNPENWRVRNPFVRFHANQYDFRVCGASIAVI